jgi:hypothetical protein
VHGALPNQEDVLRLSADYRYQALEDPVVPGSLSPHFFPQVPDWDELTRGWTDRSSVRVPDGVTVAELRQPLDPGLEAPVSRLLA